MVGTDHPDKRAGQTRNANTPVDRASGDRNSTDPLSRKGDKAGSSSAERLSDLDRQAEGTSPDSTPSG